MNEINTLTLEIMQNTGICDIETAQEIAELVINKLDYHKEQPKISPLALILAQDLQKVITSCDYDCDTCRYGEFKEVDVSPHCLSVKTAEALIALGWTKKELKGDTQSNVKRINCEDCKHLKVLNRSDIYAICEKTGFKFLPFATDTRTHSCEFAQLQEGYYEPTN